MNRRGLLKTGNLLILRVVRFAASFTFGRSQPLLALHRPQNDHNGNLRSWSRVSFSQPDGAPPHVDSNTTVLVDPRRRQHLKFRALPASPLDVRTLIENLKLGSARIGIYGICELLQWTWLALRPGPPARSLIVTSFACGSP